jgi:MoaA/NifB/PqqE/SkfB family radical SAM enzyme
MISITQYGDVLPCPWMYFSIGNIFDQSLKEICAKGMRYFGADERKCLISQDRQFIDNAAAKTYGKPLPVRIEEVMEPRGAGRT